MTDSSDTSQNAPKSSEDSTLKQPSPAQAAGDEKGATQTPPPQQEATGTHRKTYEFGTEEKPPAPIPVGMMALLGVLGVVYGDIGTSPLYAFRSAVEAAIGHGHAAAQWEIMGIVSLIFWTLIAIVTVKYVTLIMCADHNGEGGILALSSLSQRVTRHIKLRTILGLVGIVGTCLFFGDGIITPAISVLSAMEGIEITVPGVSNLVIPTAILILWGLFLSQKKGTGTVGTIFGPVMLVWFTVIGVVGLLQIINHPVILRALLPTYAFAFLIHHGGTAFLTLGAVVLCVTGAEALYADMGHFGRTPIRYAWLFFVLPMLVLNYFGQAALVLANPASIANPFFYLFSPSMQVPIVILSTLATVIASQAGISGSFSLCQQLIQFGYLPRLFIQHTNEKEKGQIYMPAVNILLCLGATILVIAFQSSDALASAYGIAVTGTFICTSILAIPVFRRQFHWPLWKVLCTFGFFLILDIIFFIANVPKVPDGGWVPLALGLCLTIMMTTWKKGRRLIIERQKQDNYPIDAFIARTPQAKTTIRVPGMAVFMAETGSYTPASLIRNLNLNKVLHDHILIVNVQNLDQPHADPHHSIKVEELLDSNKFHIYRVILRCGFMQTLNVPLALKELKKNGIDFETMQAAYFTAHELVQHSPVTKMKPWQMSLFRFMQRNAIPSTSFFQIPPVQVVDLNVKVLV